MARGIGGLVLVCAIACGRIHFDHHGAHDDAGGRGDAGSGPVDALGFDDGGALIGCGYLPCDGGLVACCTNDRTTCAVACTAGQTFGCDPGSCPKFNTCCFVPDGGSLCAGICPN
jgi:hypothetical protein